MNKKLGNTLFTNNDIILINEDSNDVTFLLVNWKQ